MFSRPFTRRHGLALLAAVLLGSCSKSSAPEVAPAPAVATAPVSPWKVATYPGVTWDRLPQPEVAGYRSGALDTLTGYLQKLPTTGLLVVTHGRVLYTYGNVTEQSYLASARKSVLSMLYGNPVAKGQIKLTSTLADLGLDDKPPLTPAERQATVRDLLITSSGVFHPASNPGDNLADAPERGSQKPGTYFLYSNWDFNALGTIYEKATGRNIYEAIEQDLARPIGMEDWRRDLQQKSGDSTRSIHPAYHMWFSTRDMARLGYLMLRQGVWLDRQVIPAEWVRESTQPIVASTRMNPPAIRQSHLGYGYLWWILEEAPGSLLAGAYSARGAYGQYILVVPKIDMVVAHKRMIPRGDNSSVSWEQFIEIARQLVGARCPKGECLATAN